MTTRMEYDLDGPSQLEYTLQMWVAIMWLSIWGLVAVRCWFEARLVRKESQRLKDMVQAAENYSKGWELRNGLERDR